MRERLAWRGVSFAYRGATRRALHGLDLDLMAGERLGIAGATGAGKSTLVRTANGTVPRFFRGPFAGEVRVNGEPIGARRVADLAGAVGILFQDFEAQLFCSNARLECAFAMENLGLSRREMQARIERVAAQLGITPFLEREPHSLSGGQKQRLALASILCLAPDALLCDEPTTDLDPQGREDLYQALDGLGAAGHALLLVEHDSERLRALDRVLVLEAGRPLALGPPATILGDPAACLRQGIRPPQLFELVARLGLAERPGSVAEAQALLDREGFRARPPAWPGAPAPGPVLFELETVRFAYGQGPPVLDGVSLTIREGEFLALLGQNGSGKTTLVKLLDALLRPTGGSVRFRGASVPELGTARMSRHLGFVFQNPDHMLFAATLFEEVAFGPRNLGTPADQLPQRVEEALAIVGLGGRGQEDPFVLTRGERQKLAVACVLVTRPQVLVLDEPTTGLDANEQDAMLGLLGRLNAAGHTVVIITHALEVAAAWARRLVLLHRGRILADGPTRELLHRPDLLGQTGLLAPPVVRLAQALDCPALTVDELAGSLTREAP